ncbi:MAG: aminopeptidase P family protein [Bacteroidota bacterium]
MLIFVLEWNKIEDDCDLTKHPIAQYQIDMMTINDRIAALRQAMQKHQLDAYLIPSSDPHQSEYVAPRWQSRTWISGFTGSAGIVIVTADHAGLWTDSRYFLQAEKELASSEMVLHRQQIPHAPEHVTWLQEHLSNEARVGFDGTLFSIGQVRMLSKAFYEKNIEWVQDLDLIDEIWSDRPQIPQRAIFEHELQYAGKGRGEKLGAVRKAMAEKGASFYFLSALDDIAWLLNLRGMDVDCNPVFVSYLLVAPKLCYLFIESAKVDETMKAHLLDDGIVLKPYAEIKESLQSIESHQSVLIDKGTTSIALYQMVKEEQVVNGDYIVRRMKAIKNETEVTHIKNAMLKDGVALTRLYRWLDATLQERTVSEVEVSDQLVALRAKQEDYHCESFPAIVGYQGNGAIVHYRALPESCADIAPEGILLLDSGGQYTDGTTDITRTVALGQPTAEQKRNFTLVLKGHIALATLKFPHGTTGVQIDALARQYLWRAGLNYGHGTGHGVGFFLNVHEAPQGIASSITTSRGSTVFEAGMFTSNEPGFYKTGAYGIRIENLILAREAEQNEYGRFLHFETLTLFPIDLQLIDLDLLHPEEVEWLNRYHEEVLEKLSPLLEAEEVQWMKQRCRAI